ncbi:unnamed protein product [Thlaspi arvense]|uniref:Bet v I/Major latex protein domain-containing protein n=1 Tax=Thlaspi arvense TaxID=13288 RepID=A0AAU9R974_THLAR|nr:unnamed protein product [Thlaspi arvense]
MALHGVSSGSLEIKSPADKFFRAFTKDISSTFRGIADDKMESMDPKKRTMTVKMSGCLISKSYKTVKATVTVTPNRNGNGSNVVWSVEFEKLRIGIDDPHSIIDAISNALTNYLMETDGNLLH